MKISEHWLREFVNPSVDTQALAERLSLSGIEVVAVTEALPLLDAVVAGAVLSVTPHPGADKLNICEVDAGSGRRLQIVCGAPNVHAGMKAPVILPGGHLPDGAEIRKATLRGVESEGMLCSARELGLADDHSGLMSLPVAVSAGTPLVEILGGPDKILEVEITPNRGDCLSILGIARELGALYDLDLKLPDSKPIAAMIPDTLPVTLEAPEACPVFAGRVIRGLRADAETPLWMRERLRCAGVRPVHPVVDVTQYVMLELGQPMHAYDLNRIESGIVVRFAKSNESVKLLEGSEPQLDTSVLAIADHSRILGMAGIMGGMDSAVQPGTSDIFLECAFFSPAVISGQSRRFGLQTEAGYRFERGVDPEDQARALARATHLLLEIAGGRAGPVTQVGNSAGASARANVILRRARLEKLLGIAVPDRAVERILRRLGMPPEATRDGWTVVAPSYRFDIELEEDLVEEVGRIYGYDRIPVLQYPSPQTLPPLPETRLSQQRVREVLMQRGYQEVITYSFVDPALQERIMGRRGLPLANPIAANLGEMRLSLWPGLIETLRYNLNRQQERIRIFEIGMRFYLQHNDIQQKNTVSGLIFGPGYPPQWGMAKRPVDFADVKNNVEALVALAGDIQRLKAIPATPELQLWPGGAKTGSSKTHAVLHPGQSARLELEGELLGWMGMLHPGIAQSLDLPQGVLLFELALEPLLQAQIPHFHNISRFPAIRRDLAVVVDESVPAERLIGLVRAAGGHLLQEVHIFDIYRGKSIDSGRKSVALGLILQDSSRTLTDEAADEIMSKVVARLRSELGATIRD